MAVASPAYLAERGAPATPQALLGHRCIRWRWPGKAADYGWEFHEEGRWFAVAVDDPVVTSDREFGVQAALDGVGIAFAIEQVVAPHVAAGRLVPLLEAWSAPFPGFFLRYPRQRHMAPALRALIDAVRASASRPSR